MASVIQNNFRVRKNYAKINKIIDIPNLIDIQKQSYDKFLQADMPSEQREDLRRRLKGRIRQLVAGVWVVIHRRGKTCLCAVQVWFRGGDRRRDYLLVHTPPREVRRQAMVCEIPGRRRHARRTRFAKTRPGRADGRIAGETRPPLDMPVAIRPSVP